MKVTEVESTEITSEDSNEIFLVKEGENKEKLFALTDIPKEFIKTDM